MKLKRVCGILTSLFIAINLISCVENKGEDTSTVNNGEEVVVATSVAVTEILDALNVKISGVPDTSYKLPESTVNAVKVGNPMSPDLEIIKSLNPSIVVSVDTLGSDYEKLFTDNNIPSEFVSLNSLEGLIDTINILGERFEKTDQAANLIEKICNKEKEIKEAKSGEEKPNILVLFAAPGSTMLATTKSYIGSLVEIAGGKNIIEDTSASYVTYNNEELTKLNPDKILVMMHALPEKTKTALEKEFAESTAWQSINAVKEGKITYLDNTYFGMSANLKVIEGLDILQEIIYE